MQISDNIIDCAVGSVFPSLLISTSNFPFLFPIFAFPDLISRFRSLQDPASAPCFSSLLPLPASAPCFSSLLPLPVSASWSHSLFPLLCFPASLLCFPASLLATSHSLHFHLWFPTSAHFHFHPPPLSTYSITSLIFKFFHSTSHFNVHHRQPTLIFYL